MNKFVVLLGIVAACVMAVEAVGTFGSARSHEDPTELSSVSRAATLQTAGKTSAPSYIELHNNAHLESPALAD
jgi:hypothetical protein